MLVWKLKDVIETGANDVYIVEMENKKELLIPAIKECMQILPPFSDGKPFLWESDILPSSFFRCPFSVSLSYPLLPYSNHKPAAPASAYLLEGLLEE